jgi:hypothetical protein
VVEPRGQTGEMATELTKSEYLRMVQAPRRRFGRLLLGSSRISLADRLPVPSYWFQRDELISDGKRYWRDPNRALITLMVDGTPSLVLYLAGRRLDSCTFAYQLTPSQLAQAVAVMHQAGIQRLIVPAAEWACREMPDSRRPVLENALRELLSSSGARLSRVGRRRPTKS